MNALDVLLADVVSTDTSPADVAIDATLSSSCEPVRRAMLRRALQAAARGLLDRQRLRDGIDASEELGEVIGSVAGARSGSARAVRPLRVVNGGDRGPDAAA